MTTDPVEDIADALVEFTNEVPDLPLLITASKPEDPLPLLEHEHRDIQIFFIPFGETSEKIGRGGQVVEEYTVTMMVVRKLDDSQKITRVVMSDLVRRIKQAIRGKRMAGYVWSGDETVSKFDLAQLKEMRQFLSVVRINYSGV